MNAPLLLELPLAAFEDLVAAAHPSRGQAAEVAVSHADLRRLLRDHRDAAERLEERPARFPGLEAARPFRAGAVTCRAHRAELAALLRAHMAALARMDRRRLAWREP